MFRYLGGSPGSALGAVLVTLFPVAVEASRQQRCLRCGVG